MMKRAELLDLSFDAVTIDTAVTRCLEFCRAPRTAHTVITANGSHLCMIVMASKERSRSSAPFIISLHPDLDKEANH